MKRNIRYYLLLNKKDLTAIHYAVFQNDFGEICYWHRYDVLALGECKKYHSPLVHFIKKVNDEIVNRNYEIVEGINVDDCIKEYKNVAFFK